MTYNEQRIKAMTEHFAEGALQEASGVAYMHEDIEEVELTVRHKPSGLKLQTTFSGTMLRRIGEATTDEDREAVLTDIRALVERWARAWVADMEARYGRQEDEGTENRDSGDDGLQGSTLPDQRTRREAQKSR